MNYIKKLQTEQRALFTVQDTYRQGIVDLKAYLLSSKFYQDPTVQVRDVLRRLDEIEQAAGDAANDYCEIYG